MAARLKQPGGSKLSRPMGSGVKGPGGGLKKPVGAPSGMKQASVSPSGGRRLPPGAARPGQAAPGGSGGASHPPKQAPPAQQPATSVPSELEIEDRVLVGGVKPGTVAFLGPTQFARGVWAGVVLDTRDGKNNGCVNGVQYFECEANKGIFARPEKLALLAKAQKITNAAKPPPNKATPPSEGEFSVGDRVAMEGGKQGEVAFCGTTEFARGIWVGVVLPVPEGKNDGRVGGVQYFECAPMHGLFTRPQKLRLVQRAEAAASPGRQRGSSQEAESGPRGDAPLQSPVLDLKALRNKLKLGDRVLVGGAKEGFLRYLGPTEFAKGVWAGVELEEPMGKNDGAVSGKRYFQCPPRHGLFAPLPKVEKLADSGPPPEDVHSSPGTPKKVAQRHARQLSGSSSGGSFGRPLPGATPPSSLQGSTAAGLSRLLQEKEGTISALQASLLDKQKEEKEMGERITELSRQVEDLQFQLEEQGVISGDKLETVEEGTQATLAQLKEQLAREREKLETVEEGTQASLAQLEEQLAREREDNATLREQLQREEVTVQSGSDSGQAEELSKLLAEKEGEIESARRELTEKEGEVESVRQELGVARQASSDLHAQLHDAHSKMEQLAASLKEAEEGVASEQHGSEGLAAEIVQAEGEVGKLRSETAGMKQDLQDALELCNQHEALLEERNHELASCDAEIRALQKEKESWADEQSRLIGEQQRLALERDQAIAECDRLMAQSTDVSSEQSELSRQRQSLMSERDQLVAERQAQHTEIEKVLSEREELQRSLSELQAQRKDVLGQSREMGAKYDTIQEELSATQTDVERLRLELMTTTSRADQDKLAMQEQIELAKAGRTELQTRVEQTARERDATLTRAQEMSDRLVEVKQEKHNLQDLVGRGNAEIERLQDDLEDISKSHQALEREVESESGALQQRLEIAEEALGEKERELAEARERIGNLTDELVISHGKRDQAMLEEEKELLEERVMELTAQLEEAQSSKPAVSMADELGELDAGSLAAQLMESQEQLLTMQKSLQDYEQQVDFLNSVIADLQQKLEAAESLALMQPAQIADLSEDEDVDQLPPPRLFCDICDEFDLHDTDDCPLQAASDSPPPSTYHEKRAPGGSDRPYCNTCEVFGHATEECEYDVTY